MWMADRKIPYAYEDIEDTLRDFAPGLSAALDQEWQKQVEAADVGNQLEGWHTKRARI